MLTAALLGSLGFETRFRTVALNDSTDEFSHVYLDVATNKAINGFRSIPRLLAPIPDGNLKTWRDREPTERNCRHTSKNPE